jgi:hypothetical protein
VIDTIVLLPTLRLFKTGSGFLEMPERAQIVIPGATLFFEAKTAAALNGGNTGGLRPFDIFCP